MMYNYVKGADKMSEEKEKVKAGEKKENSFSKFFKKTKESVSNSVLEMKIENKFKSDNSDADIYDNSLLPDTVYGYLDGNSFIAYGEQELKKNSIMIFKDKAYYIDSIEPTTVKVVLDGFEYEKKASKYTLDENVKEVNVIKADKHYYLVKE